MTFSKKHNAPARHPALVSAFPQPFQNPPPLRAHCLPLAWHCLSVAVSKPSSAARSLLSPGLALPLRSCFKTLLHGAHSLPFLWPDTTSPQPFNYPQGSSAAPSLPFPGLALPLHSSFRPQRPILFTLAAHTHCSPRATRMHCYTASAARAMCCGVAGAHACGSSRCCIHVMLVTFLRHERACRARCVLICWRASQVRMLAHPKVLGKVATPEHQIICSMPFLGKPNHLFNAFARNTSACVQCLSAAFSHCLLLSFLDLALPFPTASTAFQLLAQSQANMLT